MEVDPTQSQGAAPVVHRQVVKRKAGGRRLGVRARPAVVGGHRRDGVVVGQHEGRVHVVRQAELRPRASGQRDVEPHPLGEGRVLHQPEQRRQRRHQPPPRLLLAQPLEQPDDLVPVVAQEGLELLALVGDQ